MDKLARFSRSKCFGVALLARRPRVKPAVDLSSAAGDRKGLVSGNVMLCPSSARQYPSVCIEPVIVFM
jgi:hypothetical protein